MPKCLSVLCFLGLSDVLWTALFRHVFVSLTVMTKFSAATPECRVNKRIPRVFAVMGERRVNKFFAKWGWVLGIMTLPFLQQLVGELSAASVPTKPRDLIARHGKTKKFNHPGQPTTRTGPQIHPLHTRFSRATKNSMIRGAAVNRDPASKARRGTGWQEGEKQHPYWHQRVMHGGNRVEG